MVMGAVRGRSARHGGVKVVRGYARRSTAPSSGVHRAHALVAQWIERRATDAEVGGSIPSRGAMSRDVPRANTSPAAAPSRGSSADRAPAYGAGGRGFESLSRH